MADNGKERYWYLDYLLVVILLIVIFGKKVFSGMLFVDYGYSTFFDMFKILYMSDFVIRNYLFHVFNGVLSAFGIGFIAFQLSVLIAMLVSFYFIKKLVKKRFYALLFALIYFFNPFVYSRIMIGQLGVLLGYLTLPIYVYFLFLMFEKKMEIKSVICCVIAYTIVASFAPHFFAINFIIFLAASFWLVNWKTDWKKYIKIFVIFIVLTILLNAFWLQGFFSNPVFSVIDSSHSEFFSPKLSQDVPTSAKIVGMWGFWREPSYVSLYNQIPAYLWYCLLLILIVLFLMGYYFSKTRKASFFFTLFWIGIVFGVGTSHPYTKPIFDNFFNFVPFFNGFRDSHKFVSLIALAYAYLIPVSIINIRARLRNKTGKLLILLMFVAFVLFYTFPLINFNTKAVKYPDSYYGVAGYLDSVEISGKIIYLPWQNYLTYTWTENISSDGRISVPVNKVVRQEVLTGADSWGAEDQIRQDVRECLEDENPACLNYYGIQYVLKDKCAHYPDNYSWLTPVQSVVPMVYENECFEVYDLGEWEQEEENVPLRFVIGSLVSLITLLVFVYLLLSRREHKRP